MGGAILLSLLLVLRAGTPRAGELAASFPPWWTSARVFAAAAGAGTIVAPGRLPATLIVHGDPATLADALRSAGALLIFDPSHSAGCHAPAPELAR